MKCDAAKSNEPSWWMATHQDVISLFPKQSMGRLYIYLHENHKNKPNVGKYTLHGWYGFLFDRNLNLDNYLFWEIPWICCISSGTPQKDLLRRPKTHENKRYLDYCACNSWDQGLQHLVHRQCGCDTRKDLIIISFQQKVEKCLMVVVVPTWDPPIGYTSCTTWDVQNP